ncbi:hypothetical protein BD833_10635 [Blastococcus xanthinilyticus]|uniref:Uncharacterized protein n=1 Tax=Blastococcus xanthinilyticus TaxID=1564164 RepID=A0A5S5CWQ7_9ACTN|nr:hypothetical protein BD833_10635 [Blastococcus xanthinilyticus]
MPSTQVVDSLVAVGLLAFGVVYGGTTLSGHRRQLLAQLADLVAQIRPLLFSLCQLPACRHGRILGSGGARRLGVGPLDSVPGTFFGLRLRDQRGFRSSDRSVAVTMCLDQPRLGDGQLLGHIGRLRIGLLSLCIDGREGVGQLSVQSVSLGLGLR